MDESKKNLKGSESRDTFKLKHKTLSKTFYACDIDFMFLEKFPFPGIVAVVDYKQNADSVTFSETIAYNDFIRRGIPVYIVQGDADAGVFKIFEYVGGHHVKPRQELNAIGVTDSWESFGRWEQKIRDAYKHKYRQ